MYTVKKIKDSNKMKGLIHTIESLISANVKDNYPGYWDDDLITISLIKNLKNLFHQKKIKLPGNTLKSSWSSFILNNDIENRFGKVAIIFNINYHDGQSTQGTTLLDTHIKDSGKNTFSSIKKDKIRKLNSNFPHSQLLLYDYDFITGMAFPTVPESVIGDYPHTWNNWMQFTHAAVAQAGLSHSLGVKTTGLYKISVPFSYQLSYRYLYGLDLNYNKASLDISKGHKIDKGNAKYLLCISVAHGGAELNDNFDINREIYSPVE